MREMENGHGILADMFSVLAVSDSNASNNDSLFQVMKAVEVAETTIKHQVEENKRLRIELQQKNQELEKYACNSDVQEPCTVDPRHENACGNYQAQHSFHSAENRSDGKILSGILNVHPGGLVPAEHTDVSQFSSPATSSSSCRYPLQGEHDPQVSLSGHGLMPIAEANNANNISKQDLVHKIREHEEEIMLLRKHLADYSIKEAQIRNENYVLEKRIAHMRLAFDQQQQDLVDAASKALTYRQDIIEENIRLTYALQVAQQERSTFVSSLLPLLTEYSLQPSLSDAQSIVSSLKVLFKHLQEKLNVIEAKLKESQYQLRPWHSDVSQSGFLPQSPSPTSIADKSGLQLVRQEVYSESKLPVSSAYTQTNTERDIRSNHQSAMTGIAANLTGINEVGRYSPPLASRIAAGPDGSGQFAQADAHATHYGNEMNKQVAFRDPVSSSEMDDPDTELQHNEKDAASNWVSGNINYTNALDDPGSSYSPYLPPVLEEPSSSFSEAADDDPLPAIEDLQISGEAFPGRELQASGYSINGTTSCNFEWVRHMEDGSFNYIEGAKQPSYLVTADDVGTYLAIEVQPLDNRKRKGELVKVFSNEHRKITCDREMHTYIEKTLYTGHVSYKVSLSAGYLDIWEPSTLSIKRDAYSIKCIGSSDVVVTEKFSPSTSVTIPYGHPTEFSIIDSNGVERLLRAEGSATDISCSRDTIVLTVRVFAVRAVDRKKGKKRSLFFHK